MSESSSVASSEGEQGHNNELDAWREVHGLLTNALLVAKEAVGAKKVQRRFWLEEICANLTDGGKLTQNSVWLRPSPPKKTATKRAAKPPTAVPPTKKPRKKKSTDGTPAAAGKTKKLRKRKTNEEDDNDEQSPARPKAKKIRLKLSAKTSATAAPKSNSSVTSSPAAPVDYDHHQQPDNSDTDDDEEDDSDVDAGGSVSHYESGGGSFMRVAEYAQGDTQWGTAGQQVPLMGVGTPQDGSPESHYLPYGAGGGIQDQYSYFAQSAAAIQTGLHGQGVYSTYTTHQGGSDESSSEEEY